ncbi:uncharacterized protein [Dermacentor andersoni]|uniref:uncharacterized protein isoform X5 n=1 Tax=Dermacentor andersoni TaxID=34620 RepID=UPI0024164CAF|nr:uncharacterized protein LOC126542225 isoform X5 [Dermacentor andersoni]
MCGMLLVRRLCACLVLLHRLQALPVQNTTPSLLRFHGDERRGHYEVVLDEPVRGMNAFRVDDDLEGSKMAAGEDDDRMGQNYYNRILKKKAAVTRAKDLFDECRSNEECAATNPYLECVNRLCSCPPPHVLKDHAECIGGASVQEWISWLVPVAVLAVTGVGMAAWLISKRKKSNSDSGNSDDNDVEGAPAAEPGASSCLQQPPVQHQQSTQHAPEPRYRGYSGEGGGAVPRGYQHSDMLSRLNVPPMKDWVRVPKGLRGNAQGPLDGAGGGGAADHNRVMWAQQAFTSLASPIYQNKLVRRLMAGKGASSSYPDSSSVAEPMPPRSAMASPAPPSALSARYGSEVPPLPTSLQESLRRIAAASGRSSQRLHPHQRRTPLATCSDEASSFRSFPVPGARSGKSQRYAADDDDDDDEKTRVPLRRLRSRSSSRYSAAAREPKARSESSDALPASSRKVFFANYKK